jgi:DNA-binding transcriptional regulator LsrR (DeoR family)
MVDDRDRRELTIRAAWLYHDRRLTQQAVADRLGLSRSTISRMLADAERDGIVRTIITEPLPATSQLAEEVMEHYGLLGVTVGPAFEGETPMEAAASAMARRIENIAASGSVTIAAGWGRTLSMSAREVRRLPTSGVSIVDAFGHATTAQTVSSVEVSSMLASKFGAKVMHMPSPAFAASREVAINFFESAPVAVALSRAREADVALVSIGITGPDSLLIGEGLMEPDTMERIEAAGAVGEVLACYYDADGNSISVPELHTVGLRYHDLQEIRRVVGVAGGEEKAATVRGAVAAGILKELAIDETLAKALLI